MHTGWCEYYKFYDMSPDLTGNSDSEKGRYEPRNDKTNKVTVHPAKTQVSLIRVFTVRLTGI